MRLPRCPFLRRLLALAVFAGFSAIGEGPSIASEEIWINGSPAQAVWGQPDYTSAASGQSDRNLNIPHSIAVDPTTGKVFVSEHGNHRVLRFASFAALESGAAAEAVLGQGGFETVLPAGSRSRMDGPKGLSVDAEGRLWVADANNHRVLRFDNAATRANGANADGVLGQPDFTTTAIAGGAAGMGFVVGVLADAAGRVWVSDWDNKRVTRFDNAAAKPNGGPADAVLGQPNLDTLGEEVTSRTSLLSPAGMAMDASGDLWVADSFQARVVLFRNAAEKPNGGPADLVLGQLEFTTANMNLTSWGLSEPYGVAVDSDGTLWVTDQLFHRVLRYANPAHAGHGAAAVNVLGQPTFEVPDWGTTRTSLNVPEGVCLDPNGGIWVVDRENHRLLKYGRETRRSNVTFQPDGLIGTNRRELLGDNLYTRRGEGQKIDLIISGKRSRNFFFTAQNDGSNTDNLRVRGSRKSRTFSVKYFRLTNPRENVTGKLSRAGCEIPNLGPGKSVRFKARAALGDSRPGRATSQTLRILTISDSDGGMDKAKVQLKTAAE